MRSNMEISTLIRTGPRRNSVRLSDGQSVISIQRLARDFEKTRESSIVNFEATTLKISTEMNKCVG